MFKMFNKTVSILAVLFFAFAMTSCSGLFESQETGSVSFSLSNDQLRSIINEKQSSRALTQGNDDVVDNQLTVQIGIYSDDYEYLAGTKASATFTNIEKGSGIELTIDDVPIGKSRLLALIYEEGTETACSCENIFCGAKQITVTRGDNSIPVDMITFKGAFSKENDDKSTASYSESAVCRGVDDQYGDVLFLISEDKPFYTIIYGDAQADIKDYKVVSVGIWDIKEWYPGYSMPKILKLTELAGIGNNSFSTFDFVKNPKEVTIVAKVEDVSEEFEKEEYYKITYDIPYYGKTFSLYDYATIYMHNTLTISAHDGTKFPAGAEFELIFTAIGGYDDYEYFAGSGVLDEESSKITILSSKVEENVKNSVGEDNYNTVIALGGISGYLSVNYRLIVTYKDNNEKTVKLISTDESAFNFYLNKDSVAHTGFNEKKGEVNFIYKFTDSDVEYNKLPKGATDFVLKIANNGDFVGEQDSAQKCYTLQELIDNPYNTLSIPVGRFSGIIDVFNGENPVYFRLSFNDGSETYTFEGSYEGSIDITSCEDIEINLGQH